MICYRGADFIVCVQQSKIVYVREYCFVKYDVVSFNIKNLRLTLTVQLCSFNLGEEPDFPLRSSLYRLQKPEPVLLVSPLKENL